MNNKSILSWLVLMVISIFFWYSLVFAWTWLFEETKIKTSIVFQLSNNIYLDSLSLSKNKILFRSSDDLSNSKIKSDCNIFSKLNYNKWNYYIFDLKFFDNECVSEELFLVNEKNEVSYRFNLKLVNEYWILSKMLDLNTTHLNKLIGVLDEKISKYSKYLKYDNDIEKNYYIFLKNQRVLNEAIYNKNIIERIIKARWKKYIVPIVWKVLPKTFDKIPNSWRWYRNNYTDWIHHGWDIDWEFWEEIISLDDGIIIRVVSKFSFSDLGKIKRWKNLLEYDKIRNLDILRWKQVWLKTMKWDVVFYSHLNEIYSNIRVWEVVSKWEPIWTIWISWVPDKNYKDFHVHFPIHVNPFNLWKNDSYDIGDYMRWDWLFKWKNWEYILENQDSIFEWLKW